MKGRRANEWNPDLGLAILAARGGAPHTEATIAAYMGVSRQRVNQIVFKAMRKVRFRLMMQREVAEALQRKPFNLK